MGEAIRAWNERHGSRRVLFHASHSAIDEEKTRVEPYHDSRGECDPISGPEVAP